MSTVNPWSVRDYGWIKFPPVFTIAYGSDTVGDPINQLTISKFPLAIVDQGYLAPGQSVSPEWSSFVTIKSLNPDIQLFAYQMVTDVQATTGIGNNIVNAVTDPDAVCVNDTGSNVVYVDGEGHTITVAPGQPLTYWNGSANVQMRDYRWPGWPAVYATASLALVEAFPFTGIMFDNFGVRPAMAPGDLAAQADMNTGLLAILAAIRAVIPKVPLIGNGASYYAQHGGWSLPLTLNGTLIESTAGFNDIARVPVEAVRTYQAPIYNVFIDRLATEADITTARIDYAAGICFDNKTLYGALVDYANPVFPPEFLNIINGYYQARNASVAETDIEEAVVNFIASLLPAIETVAGYDNRVPMPIAPYILIAVLYILPLATDESSYDHLAAKVTKQSLQCTVQIDCYGVDALKLATTLSVMLRDEFACAEFATESFEIQPLYAEYPRRMPFIQGEDQYEQRWTFTAVLQYNPVIVTPMQFADTLAAGLINVDVTYPPEGA